MDGQVGPSSKLKPTLREVKEFMKQTIDDFVVLGVFSDENDPLYTTYLEANNDLRDDYVFGHTFDGKAKKHFSIKESSIIIIHPSHLVSKYEPKYQIFKVNYHLLFYFANFFIQMMDIVCFSANVRLMYIM